jgi:hypothetical protein
VPHPRRWPFLLTFVALLALTAGACGGGSSAGASDDQGDTQSAEPSSGGAIPSISIGEGSLPEGFEQRLVPPNSTVQGGISIGGGTGSVGFISTSSIDELKSFYDSALGTLGIASDKILKMDTGGGFSWIFGEGESGGLIVVAPNTDGEGNVVSVTYGAS